MHRDEQNPLLGTARSRFNWKCTRQCCVSSKPVLLILIWNFLVSFTVALFTSPDFYNLITSYNYSANLIKVLTFGLSAFPLLFYPLATCLADRKWGRYKTIVNSLYCLLCSATIMCAFGGALAAIMVKRFGSQTLHIVLGVFILVAFLLSLPSIITFKANVIQFGADQLCDHPTDSLTLYVYWYVWSSFAGTTLLYIVLPLTTFTKRALETTLFTLVPIFVVLLLLTLIIQCYKRHWFNADLREVNFNPCKLVYRITKFAIKHKYPLQRSAFTYCDDVCPSRFDFGKERYGGPFTTEQVEDVKSILQILRVLLILGPIFAIDIAASKQLPSVANHLASDFGTASLLPLLEACSITYPITLALNGSITPLIITFVIPLYICLLRPHIKRYIPGMLKQMGLGMTLLLLSLISVLLLDTIGHIRSSSTTCFLVDDHYLINNTYLVEPSSISPLYIMIPYSLNAFAYMLIYIGAYEFILSQSPHAMKGLLIGIFFAIKGVFKLLGVLTVYLPFISWSSDSSFPSCGFIYYLINIVVALTGIVAYSCATTKYQHWQRNDSPPFDQRMVEEIFCRYLNGHNDDLVYKPEDNSYSESKKDKGTDNSPTAATQESRPNDTLSTRKAELKLPDHISSRDSTN